MRNKKQEFTRLGSEPFKHLHAIRSLWCHAYLEESHWTKAKHCKRPATFRMGTTDAVPLWL